MHTIYTRARSAIRHAQHLCAPGLAVVIDTETTDFDGEIIEIAIVDASTGATLLDTLVKPSGSINPETVGIHGITEDMVVDAPTWDEVWPRVQQVVAGRMVIAYNATFDQGRIEADCLRHQLPSPQMSWCCAMQLDRQAHLRRKWRKLNAGHRALGDALAARRVLLEVANRHSRAPQRLRAGRR